MYLDFAPMEGITTALFRRLHAQYFSGVDRYYTPFLSPTQDRILTPREKREFLPEFNEGVWVIPQILTKHAEDFLWAARELHAMGYEEVNLNLGCPSGTVTAKGKGAGMLADPEGLDRFLDAIFSGAPCRISIKTRLGMEDPEEFEQLLSIYDHYPLSELIIHPRVRKDFYRPPVRRETFSRAYETSRSPLSYNGSIVTPRDHDALSQQYPRLRSVMIGQALVSDPFLAEKIRSDRGGSKAVLRSFHDALLEGYTEQFGSRTNAAKRMKELWFYLLRSFGGSASLGKKLMNSRTPEEYTQIVSAIFRELPLLEYSTGDW